MTNNFWNKFAAKFKQRRFATPIRGYVRNETRVEWARDVCQIKMAPLLANFAFGMNLNLMRIANSIAQRQLHSAKKRKAEVPFHFGQNCKMKALTVRHLTAKIRKIRTPFGRMETREREQKCWVIGISGSNLALFFSRAIFRFFVVFFFSQNVCQLIIGWTYAAWYAQHLLYVRTQNEML